MFQNRFPEILSPKASATAEAGGEVSWFRLNIYKKSFLRRFRPLNPPGANRGVQCTMKSVFNAIPTLIKALFNF